MRTRGASRIAESRRGPGQIVEVGFLPFGWVLAPAIVGTLKQIGIYVAVSEVASLVAGAFSSQGQAEAITPYAVLDAYRAETAALGAWSRARMTAAEFQFVGPVLSAARKLFTPSGPFGAIVPTMAASTVAIIKVREYVQKRVAAVNPSGLPTLESDDDTIAVELTEAELVEGVDFVTVNGGKVAISEAGRIALAKGGVGLYVAIAGAVVLAWWVLRG